MVYPYPPRVHFWLCCRVQMLMNVLLVHVVTAPRVSTLLLSIDATVETILLDLTVNEVSVHGLFEH